MPEKIEYWVCEKCSPYSCFLTTFVHEMTQVTDIPSECPYGTSIPEEHDWKQIDKKTFDYMIGKKYEALRKADERIFR